MIKRRYKVKPLFKHQMIITAVLVFVIVVSVFGVSYGVFSDTDMGDEYNVITAGNMELSYVDLSATGNTLTLNNLYPVADNVGSSGSSYRFSVENTGNIKTTYKIIIFDDESVIENDGCSDTLVDKNNIRYQFNNDEVGDLINIYDSEEEGFVIYSSTEGLNPGDSEIHEIRMWLNENSPNDVLGKHFHGKVSIVLQQAEGLE